MTELLFILLLWQLLNVNNLSVSRYYLAMFRSGLGLGPHCGAPIAPAAPGTPGATSVYACYPFTGGAGEGTTAD